MNASPLNYCRVDEVAWDKKSEEPAQEDIPKLRKKIEPWFASLFQSEHLSILIGSGFTLGICKEIGIKAADMSSDSFDGKWGKKKLKHGRKKRLKRWDAVMLILRTESGLE